MYIITESALASVVRCEPVLYVPFIIGQATSLAPNILTQTLSANFTVVTLISAPVVSQVVLYCSVPEDIRYLPDTRPNAYVVINRGINELTPPELDTTRTRERSTKQKLLSFFISILLSLKKPRIQNS